MKYTEEQEAIFDAIARKEEFIAVDARSGSAKTSSVLEAIKRKKDSDTVLVISFNKKIAMENQSKFKGIPNVECSTFHSLAIRYVKGKVMSGKGLPLKEVDTRYQRYADIYKAFNEYCTSNITSALDFARKNGYSAKMADVIRSIIGYMTDNNSYNFAAMAKLYAIGLEDNPIEYDYIVFDEFADANECYIDAFYKMKADCKVVMFDEAQRLYGFNGAVENITKHLPENATVMPLTRSFRCSKEIASKVETFMQDNYDRSFKFKGTDSKPPKNKKFMILTKGNLELLNVIIELNNLKVGFKHLKSLESAMTALKAAKSRDIKVFTKAFPELEDLVNEKDLKVKDKNGNYPSPLKVAIVEAGKINRAIASQNRTRKLQKKLPYNVELLKSILVLDKDLNVKESTFTYKNVTISTVHAIKGDENDTVYVCDDLNSAVTLDETENNSPEYNGEEDEIKEIDLMLYYVACTRAKTKLVNAVALGDDTVELKDFIRDEILINNEFNV